MNLIAHNHSGVNSHFSLRPLVAVLQKMVAQGKPGTRRLYEALIEAVEAAPEVLQPTDDLRYLEAHEGLVYSLLATIFPPATAEQEGVFAIAYPFQSDIIYASDAFRKLFMQEDGTALELPEKAAQVQIATAAQQLAYNLVLRRYYRQEVPAGVSSIHQVQQADTGLTRYYELKMNASFVEVGLSGNEVELPHNIPVQTALDVSDLRTLLPLEHFTFEGLMVLEVTDVTTQQVVAAIKNTLLHVTPGSDMTMYATLQHHVETLLGITGIEVGITPFYKMNDFNLFAETYFSNSILLRKGAAADKAHRFSRLSAQLFRSNDQPLLYSDLGADNNLHALVYAYHAAGVRSLILCPLKCDDGKLIGLLELAAPQAQVFRFAHLTQLQPVVRLFALALEKQVENLELQIDKVIKEHFTAIQPAVEWRFTEAAFNFLQQQGRDGVKMAPISFENVYPLYGAIDVRNSSLERNNAIRSDLVEQLQGAAAVLEQACRGLSFPLLREIHFKVTRHLGDASEALLSDDELAICEFLQHEVHGLFRHLEATRPELANSIQDYFSRLDSERGMVYHHRKDYEESITRINDVLDRFVDGEQKAAQEVYPHYFERYITDGLEFNIYVGQSLAPSLPFDDIYVRNMKLWQLSMLARAARITHGLEQRLPLPLQTTQLILAHSIPLSISFRRKERKFDVDGAYNIRYEIIKKRIDKVHVKDTEERLTQPGRIAIVYAQQKELSEYLEYIAFLQHEGLLGEQIEHLDLEDTQGISGLKAMRVDVVLEAER